MRAPAHSDAGLQALCAFDRTALYAHAAQFFRRAGPTEPNVVLIEAEGARAVLKDYGAGRGWFARLLGPLLIAREAQALARLVGVAGVPALYRRLDARAVLIEYLPGQPWSQARPPPASYARLAELMARMHGAGVAHCDLRAPSNILVDEAGQPYLVDFVARVHRGRPWNLAWNAVFAAFCRADRNALSKLKLKFAPELASAEDRRRGAHRNPLDRFARAIGAGVRRLTRLLVGASSGRR